jgi:hypothetical protein
MNEKDLKTIWKVPKYLPYVQPDLTEDIISEAEKKIGKKLPKEYIELLKIQNGGYIRFTIEGTPHSQISGIGPYYPSITDFEWLGAYDDLSFDVNGLFPFDGDGHWNICLDYRKNKTEPEVTYIDTESDYEKPIAATFKEYLNLLEMDVENDYVIETDSAIETILKHISDITKIKFEAPDSRAHGYTEYRSNFKDSWIWISPNTSPSGFVRKDDDRYAELKSQLITTALRYPEIPANSILIAVSEDDVRQELFNKLIRSEIKIKALKEYLNK